MRFQFLLSDPGGDTELAAQALAHPFLTGPSRPHPFLTLGDYFRVLQQFIETNITLLPGSISPADIDAIRIRSEKHGAFYHIASAEFIGPGPAMKLAITTALTPQARQSLERELAILQQLGAEQPRYLPRLFCSDTVSRRTGAGVEEFRLAAGEWLQGFHEWHLAEETVSGGQRIRLWDYDSGFRFLSRAESFELLRQAAAILTCYYDRDTFCQIYPWHHGAGDFIARIGDGGIDVRLITARQYEPLVHFESAQQADRLVAALHFLLNLSVRLRLDRLNGVDGPAWFDAFAAKAAVEGFFAGLAENEADDSLAADLMAVMRSFDVPEILEMYASLLEIYAEEDQDDFELIRAKLPDHAAELHAALQEFGENTPAKP